MEIFRRAMEIDGFQNVEKEISLVLQEQNRKKNRLKSVSYKSLGNDTRKKLVMEFDVLDDEVGVKNAVKQVAKKKYPEAVKNPKEYGEKMAEDMGRQYIGYIEPKSGKHYIYFFA